MISIKTKSKEVIQKTIPQLEIKEIDQISNLIQTFYQNATESYIHSRTRSGIDFDVVMLKENNALKGIGYYKTFLLKSPFSEKKLPVIHFGQALKNRKYSGNIIMNLGHWYSKKNIGLLYGVKKTVGISTISSPRVYEHFIKLFPKNSFNVELNELSRIHSFAKSFFLNTRHIKIDINDHFVFESNEVDLEDITADWEKFYKSKVPNINEHFVTHGIIQFKDNRVFRTKKVIVACGYRNYKDNLNLLFKN